MKELRTNCRQVAVLYGENTSGCAVKGTQSIDSIRTVITLIERYCKRTILRLQYWILFEKYSLRNVCCRFIS